MVAEDDAQSFFFVTDGDHQNGGPASGRVADEALPKDRNV
jgi:hypothetical protein